MAILPCTLNLARPQRWPQLAAQTRRWLSSESSSDALVEVNPGEVGIIAGIPEQHLRRRVIIYSPDRTVTQQGSGKAILWFDTEDAAKAFAEKYGWEYTVKKRHTPLIKPKSYADNFKWKGPPKD